MIHRVPIEVDFALVFAGRQTMPKSLEFERRPAAYGEWISQQRLERSPRACHRRPSWPALVRNRPAVHAPRHLLEPAMGYVFLAQASGKLVSNRADFRCLADYFSLYLMIRQ
jgi:hypothetical protein